MPIGPEHMNAINRFDNFWKQRIEARIRAEMPTQTLYHYTPDLDGVIGILRDCRMRFGDVRHLNDKIELTFGLRLFRKIVRQRFNAKDSVARHFLKPMRDPAFAKRLFERFHFYSASFGRRDSKHMWDHYGRQGRGFAIGVGPTLFAPSDLEATPHDEQYFAGRLRYQQTNVRGLHKDTLQVAASLVQQVCPDPKFLGDLAVAVYVDVLVTCLTSKERKWALEDEHRLFVVEDLKGTQLRKVFRPERPYVEMAIPKASFVEVMLGSKVGYSEKEAVKTLLTDHGLTVILTDSAI